MRSGAGHSRFALGRPLSNGYANELVLVRVDTDKGYIPGSRLWVAQIDNNNNKKSNTIIEFAELSDNSTMAAKIRDTGVDAARTIPFQYARKVFSGKTSNDIAAYVPSDSTFR